MANATQTRTTPRTSTQRRANVPIGATVQRQEIATATLTVRWDNEIGSTPRRARLGLLHRITAAVCEHLDAFPLLVSCADPTVTMGDARGVVRLELVDEADYDRAADLLVEVANRVIGFRPERT